MSISRNYINNSSIPFNTNQRVINNEHAIQSNRIILLNWVTHSYQTMGFFFTANQIQLSISTFYSPSGCEATLYGWIHLRKRWNMKDGYLQFRTCFISLSLRPYSCNDKRTTAPEKSNKIDSTKQDNRHIQIQIELFETGEGKKSTNVK